MPIFAPLADTVGIQICYCYNISIRSVCNVVLSAYWTCNGNTSMLNMRYSHWLRFVWPVVAFVLIFGGGLLITQVLIYS